MTWAQIATLIVSIAATVAAGTGVIVLSVNGIHSQVAAFQAQAAADRRAWQERADADRRAWQERADADRRDWQERADADRRDWQASMDAFEEKADADREAFRAEMQRLAERQAHVEGALSIATGRTP